MVDLAYWLRRARPGQLDSAELGSALLGPGSAGLLSGGDRKRMLREVDEDEQQQQLARFVPKEGDSGR